MEDKLFEDLQEALINDGVNVDNLSANTKKWLKGVARKMDENQRLTDEIESLEFNISELGRGM